MYIEQGEREGKDHVIMKHNNIDERYYLTDAIDPYNWKRPVWSPFVKDAKSYAKDEAESKLKDLEENWKPENGFAYYVKQLWYHISNMGYNTSVEYTGHGWVECDVLGREWRGIWSSKNPGKDMTLSEARQAYFELQDEACTDEDFMDEYDLAYIGWMSIERVVYW